MAQSSSIRLDLASLRLGQLAPLYFLPTFLETLLRRSSCDTVHLSISCMRMISEDEEWLHEALEALIESPKSMARILWEIHVAVKKEGYVQDLSLGVFRSDYMLHEDRSDNDGGTGPLAIKQVEFNTYSVAGGAHGNRISEMHQ